MLTTSFLIQGELVLVKIYLSGPMSGYPSFNIPAFDDAARQLRANGYQVVSPAEQDSPATRAASLSSASGSHDDLPPGEAWDEAVL